MLNWADLCYLLTIFMGTVNGFGAGFAQKAGWGVVISFTIGGLLLGISLGFVFSKMAYAILGSKKLPGTARTVLYILTPFTGLLVVVFIPVFLADVIYR